MQPRAGHGAQPAYIARIRGYLGLKQDNVEHGKRLGLYCRRVRQYQRQIETVPNPTPNEVCKLVIVDDERAFTDLLGDVLSNTLTCPVVTFTSAREALHFIQREPIGMLVTDYYMPATSGIELVQALEEAQPGVPAIMVTGHRLAEEHAKAESLTAVKCIIQKPFGLKHLTDTILKYWAVKPEAVRRS